MLYQLGKFCLKEKPLPALSPPPMCEICGEFQETTEHFLLLCSWTSVVWYGSSLNTGRKKEVSHAKAGMLSYAHDIDVFQLVCFHLWEIWRNGGTGVW